MKLTNFLFENEENEIRGVLDKIKIKWPKIASELESKPEVLPFILEQYKSLNLANNADTHLFAKFAGVCRIFLRFIEKNPYSPLETLFVAAIMARRSELPPSDLKTFQKELYILDFGEEFESIYSSEMDLDTVSVKEAWTDNFKGNSIQIKYMENYWEIEALHIMMMPIFVTYNKTTEHPVVSTGISFEDLMQQLGEQATDALEKDIRKKHPNAILEIKKKNVNIESFLFENNEENDKFFNMLELQTQGKWQKIGEDTIQKLKQKPETVSFVIEQYKKFNITKNSIPTFLFVVKYFLELVDVNSMTPFDTLFVASALTKFDDMPPLDIVSLQQKLYSTGASINEYVSVIYDSSLDFDILSIEEAWFDEVPANRIQILQISNHEWKISTGDSIIIVTYNEDTKKLSTSAGISFEDLMNQLGEQPADALEKDIREHFPNAILEIHKIKLGKLLFENEDKKDTRPVFKTVRLQDSESGKQLFLRIGRNLNSVSAVGLDDEWKKETGKNFESGVSAYFLSSMGGNKYRIIKPSQDRADYGLKDYFENMFINVLFDPIFLGQIYIVKGKLMPVRDSALQEYMEENGEADKYSAFYDYMTGTDGEPLLEPGTVHVVKQVTPIEFFENFNTNDGYPVKEIFLNKINSWIDKDIDDNTPDEFIDYLNAEIGKKRNKGKF